MRGEELDEVFAGFSGVYGDRLFAFSSSASRKGFPFLTAREQSEMLRYRPRFRQPDKAARPINQSEAEKLPPGATPLYADPSDLMLDVETPAGDTLAIDDSALIDALRPGNRRKTSAHVTSFGRALTDCRPLSIFGVQSARKLGEETGTTVDKRRFRANIYLDLAEGFAEDEFVRPLYSHRTESHRLILERDPRCMMITLDPDTGEKEPALLKKVAQAHGGMAGVYGAVLVEGMVRKGDSVELVD